MSKVESISKIEEMGEIETVGQIERLKVVLYVEVEEGSFLHIGGSPTHLVDKKLPVFMVENQPAIPASSFKGAFRHKVEEELIRRKSELKEVFGLAQEKLLVPCLPAPKESRTKAEEQLIGQYQAENCEIKADNRKITIPEDGICPVCYLFGANGIMGFLRFPNLLPTTEGLHKLDQTNIRIDRKTGTAAHGAMVKGDQVLPKTIFEGKMEIILKESHFEFGRARKIVWKKDNEDITTILDKWLEESEREELEEVRVKIINELLLKPLAILDRLGGQKSKGAGRVRVNVIK